MIRKPNPIGVDGFTLIEIIVTIVVLAIAATALLNVFSSTIRSSADPVIQQQAISIAEAYMEEISLKAFVDPDGVNAGETRASFDNVQDYNGLTDVGAVDQSGTGIPALVGYTVTVLVTNNALNVINTIPGAYSLRINVFVNHAAIDPINLTGYRTNYP